MLGLDDDDDPARLEAVLEGVGHLRGESLLHLRTAGVEVDEPGDLRQPGDLARLVRDVTNVRDTYPRHPVSYRARLLASKALIEKNQLAAAQDLLSDNLYGFSLAPQSVDWRDSLFALGGLLYRQALELESKSRLAGVDTPAAVRAILSHLQDPTRIPA